MTVSRNFTRPLCTFGRAAGLLHSESTAKSPERCKALHAHQQQRGAFGLPNLNGDTSKQYQERRLIGYSPKQLFDVVAAVEHYKEFVPWCQRSQIIQEKPPDYVEAELEVGFKLFVERYTSQVHLHRPNKVVSHVYDSTLFDHLDSTWEFKPGPTPSSTWLYFSVDFAFKSPLYRHIASVFFDEVVKHMMGAFEGRCKQLYGTSAFAKRPPAAQKMQTA
ncbi:Coenzyme Q-binding protein COQ10 homolog B, mitochondrial [Coccomyxa sp. Obi]|nr:Coenzyme Q-binding protein COQ10 homolog B, mitochondrial [Coccomyxa sp. Obi]